MGNRDTNDLSERRERSKRSTHWEMHLPKYAEALHALFEPLYDSLLWEYEGMPLLQDLEKKIQEAVFWKKLDKTPIVFTTRDEHAAFYQTQMTLGKELYREFGAKLRSRLDQETRSRLFAALEGSTRLWSSYKMDFDHYNWLSILYANYHELVFVYAANEISGQPTDRGLFRPLFDLVAAQNHLVGFDDQTAPVVLINDPYQNQSY